MTNYNDIMAKYMDELNDVVSYVDSCHSADSDMEKQLFRDIAKEEREHAEMLRHVLKKAGTFTESDNIRQMEERAEKALSGV